MESIGKTLYLLSIVEKRADGSNPLIRRFLHKLKDELDTEWSRLNAKSGEPFSWVDKNWNIFSILYKAPSEKFAKNPNAWRKWHTESENVDLKRARESETPYIYREES